jgi:mxaA protein
MSRIVLWLSTFLWIATSFAAEIDITANNPRPFGYVVGDMLEQELIITSNAGQRIDEKRLPAPGRINAWLELRVVKIIESSTSTNRIYRVNLTYQLPNSPTEVRVIELPSQRFIFSGADKPIEVKSTEWPITVGPITPEEVLAREGLEAMRSDVLPQPIDTSTYRQRVMAYTVALAALLFYWCYRYFGIPYLNRQRRPFTRTFRELSFLAKRTEPTNYLRSIELIHRALNETAGKSLFVDNLDQFLVAKPLPPKLAAMTREFFQVSRKEFFAGGVDGNRTSIEWMLQFCRAWRDIERGIA